MLETKIPRNRRMPYAAHYQHGFAGIRWRGRRRSRQVRGDRRRNFTRAVARGRSRDGALVEFRDRGGKLTVDELQRLVSISAFGRKQIGSRFGGVQVKHQETVHVLDMGPGRGGKVATAEEWSAQVARAPRLRGRVSPGEQAARAAGWTDEQIEQARQAGALYPDAVLAVERGRLGAAGIADLIKDCIELTESEPPPNTLLLPDTPAGRDAAARIRALNDEHGFDVEQRPMQIDYVALMPDGSLETVVDGQVIYRSQSDPALLESLRREAPGGLPSCGEAIAEYNAMVESEGERLLHPALRDLRDRLLFRDNPPNDTWPVRTHDAVRPGCYACVLASSLNPQWEEIVDWLAQCPPLTDIETFWLFEPDPRYSNHGWQLWVTAMETG